MVAPARQRGLQHLGRLARRRQFLAGDLGLLLGLDQPVHQCLQRFLTPGLAQGQLLDLFRKPLTAFLAASHRLGQSLMLDGGR